METTATPPPMPEESSKSVARRPRSPARPSSALVSSESATHAPASTPLTKLPWAIAVVAVIALVLVATGTMPMHWRRTNTWSAVFLTTGQVFFGHIARASSQELLLRDVYYLRVGTNLQPTSEQAAPLPDLSIVRLGSDIHAPVDAMRITRAHILFTQELREDSPVVRTIARGQETKKSDAPPAPSSVAVPVNDAPVAPPPAAPSPKPATPPAAR